MAACSPTIRALCSDKTRPAGALVVNCPPWPWGPSPAVDQRGLQAIAAWPALVQGVEGGLRPVPQDFLELRAVASASEETVRLALSGRTDNRGFAELIVAALERSGTVPAVGCEYVRRYLLESGRYVAPLTANDEHTCGDEDVDPCGLSVVMRVLQLAQFLEMETLASWCAALTALSVHCARRVSGLEAGGSVEGPAAQAMRDLLGMPNDWPDGCSGDPFYAGLGRCST